MVVAKLPHFPSLAAYLSTDPSDLPEGRFEYWDGELVPVMPESGLNDGIANYLFLVLVNLGIPFLWLRPRSCEVEVPGKPQTRLPDLIVLEDVHVQLLEQQNTVTLNMPPPQLLVEVVSPGDENSDNYKRDYHDKPQQYAARGIPEYWIVDPERLIARVGVLAGGEYQFQDFRGYQLIVSPTFPSFNLTAEQVLGAGL
jgi:Uma2 family endonuclease